MAEGRDKAIVAALERIATANEELIVLAKEERIDDASLPDPPFCPHCGSFDPVARSEGGAGHMSEFVLMAQCQGCMSVFYAVPKGWAVFQSADEALELIGERDEHNGTAPA